MLVGVSPCCRVLRLATPQSIALRPLVPVLKREAEEDWPHDGQASALTRRGEGAVQEEWGEGAGDRARSAAASCDLIRVRGGTMSIRCNNLLCERGNSMNQIPPAVLEFAPKQSAAQGIDPIHTAGNAIVATLREAEIFSSANVDRAMRLAHNRTVARNDRERGLGQADR